METNTAVPQGINFTGKLEEDKGATIFFIARKQQKTILNCDFRFIKITQNKQWNIKKY